MENPVDKTFYRKLFLLTALGLLSYFFINAANAYLVSRLGKELYSDYTITTAFLFFVCPVFLLGTTSLLIKKIPLLKDKIKEKHQFLNWNIVTLLKSYFIISLLLFLVFAARSYIFGAEFCKDGACYRGYHIVLDVMYLLPVTMLLVWNSSFLTAHKRPFLSQLTGHGSIVYLLALLLILMGFFVETLMHNHLILIISASIVFLVILQVLCISFFLIKEKKVSFTAMLSSRVSSRESKNYLQEGISLAVNQVIVSFPHIITMIMLEWMDPDEKALSYYIIIFFIASIGSIVPGALSNQIEPYLSGINNKSKFAVLQKLVNIRMICSCIWLILCLFFIFISKDLVFSSYNINFPYAMECIVMVMVYGCFFPIALLFEEICLYNDMNKKIYKVSFTQTLFLLVLSYFLIKHYSFIGAACAEILTQIYAAAFCWLIVRKQGIRIKGFGFF